MFPTRSEVAGRRIDPLSVILALGGVLLLYYLVPLVSLFVAQPPGAVWAQLTTPRVAGAVRTSLWAAVASTAVATAFGLPLAYWLARADGRAATLVTAAVVLPLVLPPVVSGMLLLTVVGPDTALGGLAAANGVSLTRSIVGVVLAQTFVASPFVVVTAKAAFEGVDRRLEHASRSLGKGRLTTFRRVTLPLSWPGVLAGMTLAFARSLGEFGATIMLAYYPRTMPVQIWVSFTTAGIERAFPVAVVLVCVAVGTLAALNALGSNPLA
ncbi:ABC transporter permease [Halostella litorea]|uniref:ABC transporter permease n=1 Tax=Halostella litorea TaxID=2528831 RepID=UPI001091F0D2|nr:ABC transporter permease [Halostella litorea]